MPTALLAKNFTETEDCAGGQDFGYNRRHQMRQCMMTVIGSAATTGIFNLL